MNTNALRIWTLMAWVLAALVPATAQDFEIACTLADIDAEACAAFHNGEKAQFDTEDVYGTLGFPKTQGAWSAGTVSKAWTEETFQYLLAFVRPVEIGSLMLSAGTPAILKDDAAYPGDPKADEQWLRPAVPPNQSGARLVPLPPGTKTRALLITDVRRHGKSQLNFVRIFSQRLHNVTPAALANADAEYTVYPSMAPPHTYAAADVVRGAGRWMNAGRDDRGRILRPPTSDIHPAWFVLSWKTRQTICGLWLLDNFASARFYQFVGPDSVNPAIGTEQEWKKLDVAQSSAGGRWVSFKPVSTRGIKILILKTHEPQVSSIDGLHAFTDLGDRAVPELKPAVVRDLEPYRIPYALPEDGLFTMVVDSPEGIRLRNIVARVDRSKGENADFWDLKDEKGQFVEPGVYTWKGIWHKPLKLRYEMTPYPNIVDNTPENAPWLTGTSGPGGWMADHTPPRAVCTAGDRVYFGAPCAESGVSFIECDLTGKKLWGYHSFAAWTGPQMLASDGTNVYVAAAGGELDQLWAVNIESKAVSGIGHFPTTTLRKRGLRGIAATAAVAAREGKLYVSVDGGESYLSGAASAADVDIESCVPLYVKKRRPRYDNEIVPDPRNDFMRLFRLTGTPPSTALSHLQSTEGPASTQHVVLAFNREVPLGSFVYPVPQDAPYAVKVSILKPDASWPPDPEKHEDWTVLDEQGKRPWDVLPAPPNTVTRALRLSFSRGADDLFSQIEDAKVTGGGVESLVDAKDEESGGKAWLGQLEGMKLLRRRFVNVAPSAKIMVNSGKVEKDGSWDAEREETRPLTADDPGIYALVWAEPQEVRGLAIMEVDARLTEIDVYTGPDDKPVDIAAADNWKKVGSYEQVLREYYPSDVMNPNARYMDGYVDFGSQIKTRAVRLRVVEQWLARGHYPQGVRSDRGGTVLDPTRCRVYGVAALKHIGGEPEVDPFICERIEEIDVATGKVDREVYLKKAGELAFNPKGELHAISENRIVKVDFERGRHTVLVDDLKAPTAMAFDGAGSLYVFDNDRERKVVRVYDAAGKYVRTIGTPGGYKIGPWDSTRFNDVRQIAVDKENQLWAVESGYWPKRISLWSTDGTFKRDFLGNTSYGGGGVLDPYDKTRAIYGNLEFELDWQTGRTRLKNLTWPNGWEAGEIPVEIDGRRYLTTRSCWLWQACGRVYLYENDHLKPVAAMGVASSFGPLQQPSIRRMTGNKGADQFKFIWCDRSGDGEVQPDEVQLTPKQQGYRGVGALFNRDLSVQTTQARYVVKEFLPNGAPVYEEQPFPDLPNGNLVLLEGGNFIEIDSTPGSLDRGLTPDGKVLWSYKTEGSGGHAYFKAKPYFPAQVVSELGVIGRETIHAGDLGEIIVTHTNVGTWHIWTSDGLLAGRIMRDMRDRNCWAWSMQEHERGMPLDELTAGNEHFQGYFCRSLKDNKYYIVAGHNHFSVVEVLGLEGFRRFSGTFTVTRQDVAKARAWELEQQNKRVYEKANVIDCFRRKAEPRIDGSTDDWDERPSAELAEGASFRINYDNTYLYLCYDVKDLGPMKNSGQQWDRLFKTGASVDLQLGLDPTADGARKAPVKGDFRLLMTMINKPAGPGKTIAEPIAVIYRPVVPGTPDDKVWHVVSPVNRAAFDDVRIFPDARMACRGGQNSYVFEAAIPLKAIGLKVQPDLRLKIDWGVLVSGKDGNEVLRRIYWSNKATSIVSDAPSEAVLHPDLWGNIRFHERDATKPEVTDALPGMEEDGTATRFVEDLEEDLK